MLLLREKLLLPRLAEHIVERTLVGAPFKKTLLICPCLKQRSDRWLIQAKDPAHRFRIVPRFEEVVVRALIIDQPSSFVECWIQRDFHRDLCKTSRELVVVMVIVGGIHSRDDYRAYLPAIHLSDKLNHFPIAAL